MTTIKCPKCSSKEIREEAGFAAQKPEGKPAQEPHKAPNHCLECHNEWWNNI